MEVDDGVGRGIGHHGHHMLGPDRGALQRRHGIDDRLVGWPERGEASGRSRLGSVGELGHQGR